METDTSSAGVDKGTDPASPRSDGKGWSKKLKRVVLLFIPKQLREIVEGGLVRAFLILVLILVVLPPLIVLLAAFWLKQIGDIDALKGLRKDYLTLVYEGFSIEEVASRSHERLDYYQFFEFDLPKLAAKDLQISIHSWQKVFIDFKTIKLRPSTPTCTLPEEKIDLFSISLAGQSVKVLNEDSINKLISLDKNWWDRNSKSFTSNGDVEQLSFKVTDEVKQLSCGIVHIEGSLRVFKDLLMER